ncbi:outer membrane protein assembly factor BamD [Desulfobacterales bacterium HSG2]|nr:outer membrane protein assembly factor BamD [Desulfobacterales bacterium HSG2]
MKKILTICMISLLFCSGCAWFQTKSEKTAEELISDGMTAFEKGKYRKSLESFEKLKDWYPFSKFAILAELKTADAHFHLGEYQEAIFAYEGFENLHPRNEAVPYVIYQVGLCHFEQIDSIDRDQTAAQKALDTFNRLVRQFPGDDYARKAREHIGKCKKNLAEHEFYVGIFYYKSKHYKAALSRFQAILSDYPDAPVLQDAQRYAGLCEKVIED